MRQETPCHPSCQKTGSLRGLTCRSSGRLASGAIFLLAVLFCAVNSVAYSVLTHQELIDLAWNDSIRPLLLARFPNATDEQLREAHVYASGGSAIQDMGYYRFGKQFFSNLLVLLCYKRRAPQKGQPESCRSRILAVVCRSVAMDQGLCRSARTGRTPRVESRRHFGDG